MTLSYSDFDQHLIDDDLGLFTQQRMTAFGKAAIDIANDPDFDQWSFSAKIRYCMLQQVTAGQERRTQKLLKASQTPHPEACIEELRYLPNRNINRELISRIAQCQWIDKGNNLIIIGSTGVGKTYLAEALINQACRKNYSALFTRVDDLQAQLAIWGEESEQRYKLLKNLKRVDLLVLDDFLTTEINTTTASIILNVLAAREQTASTLVTSQFGAHDWYKSISDAVLAESILGRLIGGAETIELNGPNLRIQQQ